MKKKLLEKISFLAEFDISDIEKAIKIAEVAHQNQYRLGGEKYINHPLRVAEKVVDYFLLYDISKVKIAMIAALLHDVVEDSSVSLEEISNNFNEETARIIFSLSHPKNPAGEVDDDEPDEVYLPRIISGGLIAIIIKRFDVLDNLASLPSAPVAFQIKSLQGNESRLWFWDKNDSEGADLIRRAIEKIKKN